jgi:murein DD-endopeptidase MepM/ murein hydrolase activator NlpD
MATQTPIVRPTTTLIPRTPNISGTTSSNCCPISDNLIALHKELKGIESIIRSGSLFVKKLEETERRKKEIENRKNREKAKEKKVNNKSKIDLTMPAQTGGILQSINQFILMNLLALATPKLIEFAPQIAWVTKNVIYLSQFISKFTTEFFKNVVKSIDFGYKVYDTTRKIVKNIGGENFEKVFDNTTSLLNKFFNGAIIVGLTLASSGSGSDGRLGDGRRRGGNRGRPRVASSDDARNPFRSRPGDTSSDGFRNPARVSPGVTASGEAKLATLGFKNVIKKIEIIGPLLGFVIDLLTGEPVGRAAAGAVGSLIGMGIAGALVGAGTFGFGAIVGGMIGGYLGDLIGTSLYDAVAPMVGWQVQTQAQGGSVGQKTITPSSTNVSTRRTKTRGKPTTKRFTKVQPGRDVGGIDGIKKIYPDPSDDKQVNPYRSLVRTSEILKKNSFGALMAAGVDLALGQKVDKSIFKNFADQLNYMVESSYDPESTYGVNSVSRQILTAAGGGQVLPTRTGGLAKNNFSDQLYDSMISMMNIKSNDIFSEIRKNLSLTGPDETSPGSPTSGGDNGGGSPNLIGHANATEVYNYLVNDLHFTPEAASGVLGNLLQESGAIDPRQVQRGGGNGKGILQWDPDRWGKMLSWARENNKDPYKLRTQLEWMTIEMKQRGTFNRLKGLTDVRKAVELFEKDMEDAGVPMMEKRYSYAANAYASFAPGAANFGRMIGTTVIDEADVANDRNPLIGLTPGEGFRQNRRSHTGIDIGTYNKAGWYVGFRMSGKVTYAGTSSGYGNLVIIKCGNIEFYFAHLASIMIKNGQQYNGETIGEIGKTGGTDDIHLHFEARPNGTPVDPRPYLKLLSLGRRLSGSAGQQPPGARQPTGTTPTGNNRPRSNALGEYQGNNDGASTSTTPQSTNIAQLAPPGQQPQSGSSAGISGRYTDGYGASTQVLFQPVLVG